MNDFYISVNRVQRHLRKSFPYYRYLFYIVQKPQHLRYLRKKIFKNLAINTFANWLCATVFFRGRKFTEKKRCILLQSTVTVVMSGFNC